MLELGITESFVVKQQVLLSASEAAEMILRVDNIIRAAPRQRQPDPGHWFHNPAFVTSQCSCSDSAPVALVTVCFAETKKTLSFWWIFDVFQCKFVTQLISNRHKTKITFGRSVELHVVEFSIDNFYISVRFFMWKKMIPKHRLIW